MSNDDDDLTIDPTLDFRPGWPSILPCGLIVARSTVSQLDELADDADIFDDDDVEWAMHIGVRPDGPRLALIGDLQVKNAFAFAGVTVLMPMLIRDEPDEIGPEFMEGILKQYGPWASSFIYDHAATVLRATLAGNGLPLVVPFGTPPVTLLPPRLDADEPGALA